MDADLVYMIANACDDPRDVLNLAKLNRENWLTLQPLLYKKEVMWSKVVKLQRLAKVHEEDDWSSSYPEEELENYLVAEKNLYSDRELRSTALHRAIENNDECLVRKLVRSAKLHNPGYIDGRYTPLLMPPLLQAVNLGREVLVEILIEAGCDIDTIFGGHDTGLNLEEPVQEGIHSRCTIYGPKVAGMKTDCHMHTGPSSVSSEATRAADANTDEEMDGLGSDEKEACRDCQNAVFLAIEGGHRSILALLINAGASVNYPYYPLLQHACRMGRIDIVRDIVDYNPDLVNYQGSPEFGWNLPFVEACRSGNLDQIEFFLGNLAVDINTGLNCSPTASSESSPWGQSALEYIIDHRQPSEVDAACYLVQSGADYWSPTRASGGSRSLFAEACGDPNLLQLVRTIIEQEVATGYDEKLVNAAFHFFTYPLHWFVVEVREYLASQGIEPESLIAANAGKWL